MVPVNYIRFLGTVLALTFTGFTEVTVEKLIFLKFKVFNKVFLLKKKSYIKQVEKINLNDLGWVSFLIFRVSVHINLSGG